ncbi:hypothetical protein MHYP_G00340940 [Metynnis hypsauchen]
MRMSVRQTGEVRLEVRASMGSLMEGLAQQGLVVRLARCGWRVEACCCGLQQKHKDGNTSNEEIPWEERGPVGGHAEWQKAKEKARVCKSLLLLLKENPA